MRDNLMAEKIQMEIIMVESELYFEKDSSKKEILRTMLEKLNKELEEYR